VKAHLACLEEEAPRPGRAQSANRPPVARSAACLAAGLLLAGCTKQQFVDTSVDGLWLMLYIAVGVISLFLIVVAFAVHKALGVLATVGILGGLVTWYCLSGYSEPAEDQPHGTITFLAESNRRAFKVRIDNSDIRFWYHSKGCGEGNCGEYTVRIAPGKHDIRMGYSDGFMETPHDVHYEIDVEEGQAKYISLSTGGIGEMTETTYERTKDLLKLPQDQRIKERKADLAERLKELAAAKRRVDEAARQRAKLAKEWKKMEDELLASGDKTVERLRAQRLVDNLTKGVPLSFEQKFSLVEVVRLVLKSKASAQEKARTIAKLCDAAIAKSRQTPTTRKAG